MNIGNDFDLLALEPHKVSKDLSSYTSMIYGVPKVGKTTFTYNMFGKEGLILAFEKGYGALAGAMAVDIAKWSDLAKVNKQLKREEVKSKFKVLILDTYDLMYELAKNHILQTNGIKKLGDLPYGQAYAEVDELVKGMLSTWQSLGYGLCFISHSIEKTYEVNGQEIPKYIPSANNRALGIAAKMCDVIGFAYLHKNPETSEEQRVLYLRETLRFQAGTRFRFMPKQILLNSTLFKEELKKAIELEEKENPNLVKETKEQGFVLGIELEFAKIKKEIIQLVTNKFAPAGRMAEVTKIIENNLGIGAKIMEATENQVQALDIILTELKELDEASTQPMAA